MIHWLWTRARLRYSLRTFLFVVTLACLWLGLHCWKAQRQKEAVATVHSLGGWVRYDYQLASGVFDANAESAVPPWVRLRTGDDFFHRVVEVNLVYSEDSGTRSENEKKSELPLEFLRDLPNLTGLFLYEGQASDANLAHVGKLHRLKKLFIRDAVYVTDAGVAKLESLKNLKYIQLSNSQITDRSLAVLSKLPKLKGLSLQFNRFTDSGVKELASLQNLESLWVCGRDDHPNEITDGSLEFVLDLPSLKSLGIQRTRVSADFETRVAAKYPKCIIASSRN